MVDKLDFVLRLAYLEGGGWDDGLFERSVMRRREKLPETAPQLGRATLGGVLRSVRERRNLTWREMARLLALPSGEYTSVENDERSMTTLSRGTWGRILGELNVGSAELCVIARRTEFFLWLKRGEGCLMARSVPTQREISNLHVREALIAFAEVVGSMREENEETRELERVLEVIRALEG